MNFENEFDPYGAMSTPLYHTITFQQVMLAVMTDRIKNYNIRLNSNIIVLYYA